MPSDQKSIDFEPVNITEMAESLFLDIRPFRHFVVKDEAYCPKCGYWMGQSKEIRRKLCTGGWFKSCPKKEHFHHQCRKCDGKWMEGTYEMQNREIDYALKCTYKMAFKAGYTPDRIKEVLHNLLVKQVMED